MKRTGITSDDDVIGCALCVVVINYRTPDLTRSCLGRLLPELGGLDARVVVVDNCSGDGSADQIEAWLAEHDARGLARIIRSPVNSGFSGGNNLGMASQPARFYLLVNSDAYVRPGAVNSLLAFAKAHPEAGLIGPRLEDEDETPQVSCFRAHSPFSELIAGAASGPVTRLLARFDVPLDVSDEAIEPEWLSFACVLIRAEVLASIGPMDEGYFMYYEDADYCLRAKAAGWRLFYLPHAHIVHLRGGSSPVKALAAGGNRLPRYYYVSRTRYYRRFYGPLGPVAANLMWMLGRLIARLRPIFGHPPAPAHEGQARDIWTNWRAPLSPGHSQQKAR